MNRLSNKRIVLGVTGGIAAYKSADLIRRLREAGADIRVVMTKAAQEFITTLTMQALSGNSVHTDLLDASMEAAMGHIELARWADAIIVAPASADFMANLAYGHANDLLTTVCLASNALTAIAPAMNQEMWIDPVTQENYRILKQRDIAVFGPASGSQACGDIGPGRMLEPIALVESLANIFTNGVLSGVHVIVTAGPTHENIDPVRYLTNYSSGKMGYAIADAAIEANAKVTLISGPTRLKAPERVKLKTVTSAQEMYEAVFADIADCDILISNAAVADYRCKNISPLKIVKSSDEIQLHLIRNPDIISDVVKLSGKPFVVGFAAETDNVMEKAMNKMKTKGMDMIAANQVGLADRGFDSDNNAMTVFWDNGKEELPLAAKSQIARQLINIIVQRYALYEKGSIKNS